MKAFITKYSLTSGIEEVDAELCEGGRMISISNRQYSQYEHIPNWHRTREAAVAKAETMRVAKIASLRKSIAKLEKLSFTSP